MGKKKSRPYEIQSFALLDIYEEEFADTIKLWTAAKFCEVFNLSFSEQTPVADILEYSSIFQADERCDVMANNFILVIHLSCFPA